MVVRLVLPDFRARIVRCARLRLQKSSLGDLADIQVTELDHAILGQKHICALDVTVHDLPVMQGLQTMEHLDKV